MSFPTNGEFSETVSQGVDRLQLEVETRKIVDGRYFRSAVMFNDIMNATAQGDLLVMQNAARMLYPFKIEGRQDLFSPESQTAIRGLLLNLHMIRQDMPASYDPFTDLVAKRFDPLDGWQTQPDGAHAIERIGQGSIERYGISDGQLDFFDELVDYPGEAHRVKAIFGFGLSLLDEVTTLDGVASLESAAEALAESGTLYASQIDWL